MSRYTLAVLSDSPDYIDHFLMFINNSQVLQADAIGFTDMNALMDYLASGMIDILLLHGGTPPADEYLSSDYYYMEGVGTDERNRNTDTNANINILAVLSEHQDMCSVPVHINMYRPMKLIEKDLASLIAALDLEDPSLFRNLDITGIYTRGTGADPYSIAMDIISAAEYPYNTLYLDLDTFSGLDIILDAGSAMTLSDLIYYYLTAPEMLHTQAKAGVIHTERATSPLDKKVITLLAVPPGQVPTKITPAVIAVSR